jgi:hypothetical protein
MYHLNPKIHTRSCDTEARKKNYSIKIQELKTVKTVSIRTTIVLSSKNCTAQKHFHSIFRFN